MGEARVVVGAVRPCLRSRIVRCRWCLYAIVAKDQPCRLNPRSPRGIEDADEATNGNEMLKDDGEEEERRCGTQRCCKESML